MRTWVMVLAAPMWLALAGCNQSAQLWPTQWSQRASPQDTQLQDLAKRAAELDSNNRELQTQNGLATQQVQILRDEVVALRKQIKDTAELAEAARLAQASAERKMETMQTSLRHKGSAVITANSSLRQSLSAVDLPGFDVRQDGDLIRIAIPADQLFSPGTANLNATSSAALDRVAEAIQRQYPKQLIGIEGFTDNGRTVSSVATPHQLTSAQAAAVLEQLVRRNRLPAHQLMSVAHGANHPLTSNATPTGQARNRRIEIVIYPETIQN